MMRMLEDRILLREIKLTMSKSGVLALPADADLGFKQFEVLAVGPGLTRADGELRKVNFKPGDIILVQKPNWMQYDVDQYVSREAWVTSVLSEAGSESA